MPTRTPSDRLPALGAPVSELTTPQLVVDLDVMERNIARYVAFAEEHDVRLRSHAKTHKTPALAHLQDERSGGGGILCQTLSEAEVMAHGGVDDVFLSYQVVGDRKLERLVRLADSVDRFATTVDCPGNVRPLAAVAAEHDTTVEVILELDPGMGRTGVALGEPAVEMAATVADRPALTLAGVLSYEAHVKEAGIAEAELERQCLAVMDDTRATVERIEAAGIPVDEPFDLQVVQDAAY